MTTQSLKTVNRKLVEYSELLFKEWFPAHGIARFNLAISCGERTTEFNRPGDPDDSRSYKHKTLPKIDSRWVDNWRDDLDHGVFHGLMVGFVAYLVKPDLVNEWLPDFLLHDFLKCSDVPEHDRLLAKFFCLRPETLNHENPKKDQENCPLVIGDRVELMRYSDHQNWLDFGKLKRYDLPWDLIDTFYSSVRPHLKKVFADRDDVWARHLDEAGLLLEGCEERGYGNMVETDAEETWPRSHWCPAEDFFAVDTGHLLGQDGRANRLVTTLEEMHLDADHDRAQGLISLRTLKSLKKEIRPSRDHFAINGRIPFEHWVFLGNYPANSVDVGYAEWEAVHNLLPAARQFESQLRFQREK